MERLTLAFVGTTLDFPNFGKRVRISLVAVQANGGEDIDLRLLDGAGEIAYLIQGSITLTSTVFAVGCGSGSGTNVRPLPPDFIVEETDRVRLTAGGAIATSVVVSFVELEKL